MTDSVQLMTERQQAIIHNVAKVIPTLKKKGKLDQEVVIKRRIQQVEQLRAEFRRRDAELRMAVRTETRDNYEYFAGNQKEELEDSAEEVLDELDAMLVSLHKFKPPAENEVARVAEIQPSVPLPRMEIPRFSGILAEWPSFRDRFSSLLVNNKRLTDDQRMHYLITALDGEPLNAVKHLDICSSSFAIAWEILSRQYENERELVFANIKKLLEIPYVESGSYLSLKGLCEEINTVRHALRKLERDPDQLNDVLVYLITDRLDAASREAWETLIGISKKVPSYSKLEEFLAARVRILQSMSTSPPSKALPTESDRRKKAAPVPTARAKQVASAVIEKKGKSCIACTKTHNLLNCSTFAKLPVDGRAMLIEKQKRCYNCFAEGHFVNKCTSGSRCRCCKKKHHTLLHKDVPGEGSHPPAGSNPVTTEVSSNSVACEYTSARRIVLLATARVKCYSSLGRTTTVRALLDQGSEATLISERIVQLLRLPRKRSVTRVRGASDTMFVANGIARVEMSSVSSTVPSISVEAIIVKSVVQRAATRAESFPWFSHLEGLTLADPCPLDDEQIDILIGSDLYSSVFLDGIRRGRPSEPMAQETIFGWILSGPLLPGRNPSAVYSHHLSVSSLEAALTRFWQVEEVPSQPLLTDEERACEEHFRETHSRESDGRYILRLPFKTGSPPQFTGTYSCALAHLRRVERRLEKDPSLKQEYREFMEEYEHLGHMRAIENSTDSVGQRVYHIPHHAVVRESSATTRLRVVFNASARDSVGNSLNDYLLPGPRLQTDLTAILLRWRQHQYVMTGDIAKMFRQILIHPSETDFQRILWRSDPSQPVVAYRLLTVTYGTTSAPYQAIRVLKQLVEDEGSRYPSAVDVIENQTYVDDCLFGADTIEATLETRDQAIALLESGGFRLRKWASNEESLLVNLDREDHGVARKELRWDETLKILGIEWNPLQDDFQFRFIPPEKNALTKRGILSIIARLFDPLGWLTPVIIVAKILIQDIWKIQSDWDDPLPVSVVNSWNSYMQLLPSIDKITIPRWTAVRPRYQVEFHGFADASTSAYAAVVYIRVSSPSGPVKISLLIAKSRVAPIKPVSIPRLELCAAVLLSNLMKFTRESLRMGEVKSYGWSDSTVTLAWLRQPPNKWKPFVAHRVAKIQDLSDRVTWRYVPTESNPADCASRGVRPDELTTHPLWWTGPPWLTLPSDKWPSVFPQADDSAAEEARSVCRVNVAAAGKPWELQGRYSSWTRLIRVTALLYKCVNRFRRRVATPPIVPLQSSDLSRARIYWLRVIQEELFPEELKALKASTPLPTGSSLSTLSPFLDEENLIRARGRLKHAPLNADAKSPILLRTHPLVKLLIAETHEKLLHGGLQMTLSYLRQRYWLIRARPLVRSVLHRCVKCTRENARISEQLMGNLPECRVNPSSRAFEHTGIDYAGPVAVRMSPGRGSKSRKAYIALFICMATKAIHLELVSECSTNAFIAAYQRFIARRGQPSDLYSDNGTNFHGADRQLNATFRAAVSDEKLGRLVAQENARWHFIPPAAPHFGGLWEAAVRSVKHHLRRCTSTSMLTYEELTTLLCRVEACLNSRPLVALTDCLEDYNCLTPGHFLIGQAITTPPEPSLLNVTENRLNRWQRLQQLTEQFWKAWLRDYVHNLQQRTKWKKAQDLAREGRIVLLHEPGSPPSHWPMGRIIKCHPGDDGLTRVVTVKTQHATLKRPLAKLTFLPEDISSNTEGQSVTAGGS